MAKYYFEPQNLNVPFQIEFLRVEVLAGLHSASGILINLYAKYRNRDGVHNRE